MVGFRRDIDESLIQWKQSKIRLPLLLRGARQVGKTFSVINFGHRHFRNCVVVNFEERAEFSSCFTTFNISEILEKISILTDSEITPGETLLFLDEIQECPAAITALRYFHERLPQLHVIGAGSLLEFVFRSEDFRMPVGRVSSLFMQPMTLAEFMDAQGGDKLNGYLNKTHLEDSFDSLYQQEFERILRRYLLVGGMPKVVAAYLDKASSEELKTLQTSILQTYQMDFSKYASTAKHKYLKEVFLAAPGLVGQQCKYSHINPNIQSRDLKSALQLLVEARCLTPVYHSSGQGIPLAAQINQARFKLLFLDVGLMQRALGLEAELLLAENIEMVNRGSLAEQFVGQELLASQPDYEEKSIYFWAREKKSSSAEVDFLVVIENKVIPVEVKSGKTGRLKSLRLFLDEHPESPFAIRFSLHELSYYDRILSIPLYMVGEWRRLAEAMME